MLIKMSGYSGYLGSKITERIKSLGHQVEPIGRDYLYGDINKMSEYLSGSDVIINLAGAPIISKWTDKNRKEIYESRVKTTQNIVKAINKIPKEKQPKKFISASAIGIYESFKTHDEKSTNFKSGFLNEVVLNWEKASEDLPNNITRIIFRISMVLGKDAGAVKMMTKPFKFGIGGKMGNGKQPFPFVHINDVVKAFATAVEDFDQSNLYNLVAPEKINNKEFTKTMGKVLHRPTFFTVPKIALRLLYGKSSVLILEAPYVEPKALLDKGFVFDYPTIEKTLQEIYA